MENKNRTVLPACWFQITQFYYMYRPILHGLNLIITIYTHYDFINFMLLSNDLPNMYYIKQVVTTYYYLLKHTFEEQEHCSNKACMHIFNLIVAWSYFKLKLIWQIEKHSNGRYM